MPISTKQITTRNLQFVKYQYSTNFGASDEVHVRVSDQAEKHARTIPPPMTRARQAAFLHIRWIEKGEKENLLFWGLESRNVLNKCFTRIEASHGD